jgi:ABC-type branched-subunit amino acid transport system ATPase component
VNPLLEASGLQVQYRNGALGVIDVSLVVLPGQTVALLGPNGAGKSTTLRAISGHLRSEGTRIVRGSVTLKGADITNVEPHRAAKLGVICVPERRKVFPNLSVIENLLAGRATRRGKQRNEGLDRVFGLFPILAERRQQRAGSLSGGQQQMLAIGGALMSKAELLLVDEMTLGLHPSVQATLYEAITTINRDGTAILISDESAEFALQVSDHWYVIRDGLIHAEGDASAATLATGALA